MTVPARSRYLERMGNPLTSQLATRACDRYNAMCTRDPDGSILPALAWRAIGVRLWAASHALAGDARSFQRGRASDAHRRADYAGQLARRPAA